MTWRGSATRVAVPPVRAAARPARHAPPVRHAGARGGPIPALVAVAALLATGLTACNKQTSSCDFQTGKGGECVIDTTGSANTVQLSFFVTPGKSGNDFADH